MKLQEAIDIYFERLKANNKLAASKAYKTYYKTFASFMISEGRETIESITEADWYKFANYLNTRYSHNSRAYCINSLRPFFAHWRRRKMSFIEEDTIISQRYLETLKYIPTIQEYEALLDLIGEDTVITCRDTLIVRLLAETGMRLSELVGLNIEDLGSGQDCVAIIKRTRKSNKIGHVMWTKETNKVLHKWLGFRLCQPGEHLFMSMSGYRYGERLTGRSVERIVSDYGKLISEERITPHTLRHMKAHSLLRSKATDEEFSLIMRHSNWNSRLHYLRLSKEEFKKMAHDHL